MKTITLSNKKDSLEMSQLAVGHGGIGHPEQGKFSRWYLDEYFAAGGNCIDTARLYGEGTCERHVGEYIKKYPRDKVVVVTKCAHYDRSQPIIHRLAPDDIRFDINTSLVELDVDYIDVMFLHRDDIHRPVEEIMTTLHEFVKAGKVRMLGTSNWTAGRIQAANDFANANGLTPFSVSQIQYSLAVTTPGMTDDLSHVIMDNIEYHWYKDNKFPVMCWSATGHGFFSKLASGGEQMEWVRKRYNWTQENYRRFDRIKKLSEELNVSVGTLAVSYLMSDEDVPTIPIVGFSRAEQFEETMLALNVHLTREQRRFLEFGDI